MISLIVISEKAITKEIREVCNQKGCEEKAVYRYTWPGEKEELICKQHVSDLSNKVNEMGLTLIIRPIMENKEIENEQTKDD